MILQLNPAIPVVTPDGKGWAYFLTDYGVDADHMWTVCLSEGDKTGQFWSYMNPQIRMGDNVTLRRTSKETK